ncbi:MAG TPA: DNA-directed RNA polymerase subunit omega [Gelria sp.]|nr:DNA-directed RNA polymerase subunit omega [Gelria sp.]
MIPPSTKDLMEVADSKYAVVVAVARRARMLSEESKDDEDYRLSKVVSTALDEIMSGKITIQEDGDSKAKED